MLLIERYKRMERLQASKQFIHYQSDYVRGVSFHWVLTPMQLTIQRLSLMQIQVHALYQRITHGEVIIGSLRTLCKFGHISHGN